LWSGSLYKWISNKHIGFRLPGWKYQRNGTPVASIKGADTNGEEVVGISG
jgi:hypothetical protein